MFPTVTPDPVRGLRTPKSSDLHISTFKPFRWIQRSSVRDLVTSSGAPADCILLNTPLFRRGSKLSMFLFEVIIQ